MNSMLDIHEQLFAENWSKTRRLVWPIYQGSGDSAQSKVVVTSLYWAHSDTLLIAYKDHGVKYVDLMSAREQSDSLVSPTIGCGMPATGV
jgi:hypothetical protein